MDSMRIFIDLLENDDINKLKLRPALIDELSSEMDSKMVAELLTLLQHQRQATLAKTHKTQTSWRSNNAIRKAGTKHDAPSPLVDLFQMLERIVQKKSSLGSSLDDKIKEQELALSTAIGKWPELNRMKNLSDETLEKGYKAVSGKIPNLIYEVYSSRVQI